MEGKPVTKTLTLVEFLTARLDEDEALARRAAPFFEGAATEVRAGYLKHLVRHHPDYVLRKIGADRRIVELHHLEWRERPERVVGESDDPWCAECIDEEDPCRTLRALAWMYWDHQDYREEWRP